ncbi:hypothetical protein [Actinoplanes auranticolor]|nr:hypothetical protein [Actinoplanes auranticolor]
METAPAAKLVSLGRRSVRRRRSWAFAAGVALVATVALPFVLLPREKATLPPATTVNFGGLAISVPKGWKAIEVPIFSTCTAQPRTVYLAPKFDFSYGQPSEGPPGDNKPVECPGKGKEWIAAVQSGFSGVSVNPQQLMAKDGQLLEVQKLDEYRPSEPDVRLYGSFSKPFVTPTVFISGPDEARDRLIKNITWPAGPSAPPGGGLALPSRVTSGTAEEVTDGPPYHRMVAASDAKTLNQIRSALAALREPVPTDEACDLKKPGAIGIILSDGENDSAHVVIGDETCPVAVSTGGGQVRVPPELGKQLLALIVASDKAATERARN